MDIERVENGSPWTFNNHLLILHRLRDDEDSLLIPLIFSNFWVQVHDLHLGFFSKRMAKQFGDFISLFVEYDTKQGSGVGRILYELESKLIFVLPRRASVDNSVWLRKDGDDRLFDVNKKMRNELPKKDLNIRLGLQTVSHDSEDDPIQVGEGKRQPRSAYFSSKNHVQHPIILLMTKFSVTRIKKVRMECGILCGIDVGADGSREKGGIPRDDRRIEEFRNVLEDCALEDIGYIGPWFTWECGNLHETNIKERLDREVTTVEKSRRIAKGLVSLNLGGVWRNRSALTKRLSQCLEELNQKDRTDEVTKTPFFSHKFTSNRRHFNKIRGLQDVDRRIVSHSVDIERVARNYFNDLFSSKGTGDTTHLLFGVNRRVTVEMNNGLTVEFKMKEVQKALKFIGPTKS
ncbi:hypothetical protein Gohar_013495 [Gossypium harknessii]|uniref:DUF4283 domain-containing protein n=1 Tax=Gossypium harknessii TaxID=34285 RepID=A0A7J9H0A3_9ROSI|nr:hypothetical protein [Gossypium harknessii]